MPDNILSRNIEAIRKLRGQNVTEFAASIGLPKTTYNEIRTSGNTTLDTLNRISEGTNIPAWLLLYDGSDPALENMTLAQHLMYLHTQFSTLSPKKFSKIAYAIEMIIREECASDQAPTAK